tara:strand:- start:1775 stop:2965 length:1191 start_codon:yes stop_codon:yes gene_type:complete
MRFGSVCSGIEAASVAWPAWQAAWFAEIEPFPCALLQHHYPSVPNLGDMTRMGFLDDAKEYGPIDLLVGGTPCQSFSVAGLRQGLDDDRGNLALQYTRIAQALQPSWVIWENVPGVLSSNGGRDFGSILGALEECGYEFAYRVLDAQHFGVPQRRRRVFVVGHLGDWRRAAAVLFERDSLSGHPGAGKETRQNLAGCLGGGSGSRGWSSDTDRMTFLGVPDPAYTLADSTGNRTGTGRDAQDTFVVNARQDPVDSCKSLPLGAKDTGHAVAIHQNQRGEVHVGDKAYSLSQGGGKPGQGHAAIAYEADSTDLAPTVTGGAPFTKTGNERVEADAYLAHGMQVRRLTPRECERLQGFPDDYTLIPYRGKPAADAPRYKALGNSMAVPVMRWIGERIG